MMSDRYRKEFRILAGLSSSLPSLSSRVFTEAGTIGQDLGRFDVKIGMVVGATGENDKQGRAPSLRVTKFGDTWVEVVLHNPSGAWGRRLKAFKYTWQDDAYRRGGAKNPSRLVYPDPNYYRSGEE